MPLGYALSCIIDCNILGSPCLGNKIINSSRVEEKSCFSHCVPLFSLLQQLGCSKSAYSVLFDGWDITHHCKIKFLALLCQKNLICLMRSLKRSMKYIQKTLEFFAVMAVSELLEHV